MKATTRETIKDFYNKIIGYIDTETDTTTGAITKKIAYDFYKRKLGTWEASTNYTKDFFGRIVARGDAVTGLIFSNEEQEKARKAQKAGKK